MRTQGGSAAVAARRAVVVALVSSVMLLIGAAQGSAQTHVAAVQGSAYGYSCIVSVFGDSCTPTEPRPAVTISSDGSNSPQTATAASGRADAGPATVFSSGRLTVSSQGTLGPTGSVASSTNITGVNASGQENFTAAEVASSCTKSLTGASGSTTIVGGKLQTDNGDSDPTNTIPDHPPLEVSLPAAPPANTTYNGHLHIGDTTDSFKWVFNEQTVDPDGSLAVNAAHEYLIGPLARGDLVVGRAVCGATTGTFMAVDRTPPEIRLGGPRAQRLRASVRVGVSCQSEACRAVARGTVRVPRVGAARARVYTLGEASANIPKGVQITLRPQLPRAARRAIRRALRRGALIRVKLDVTATDEAGNKTTRGRWLRLRIRRKITVRSGGVWTRLERSRFRSVLPVRTPETGSPQPRPDPRQIHTVISLRILRLKIGPS